jgi:hypothetical protein
MRIAGRNVPKGRVVISTFALILAGLAFSPAIYAQMPAGAPLAHPVWAADPTVTGTGDWDNWKRNCAGMAHNFGKDSFLSCATDSFRSRPFHFVVQSVVPGSGVGGGGHYGRDLNRGIWQNDLQLSNLVTIRQFWFTEMKFTGRRPALGSWNTAKGKEDFAIQAYARSRQMPTLPFYGLGPNTNVSSSVKFSERDTRAGVIISSPLAAWFGLSGRLEGLWPNIGGVTGTNILSIRQTYTEQTAPGLNTQPNFLHYEILARPHVLLMDRFLVDYRFRYGYFQDMSTGHYSFRRFETDFGHSLFPERENDHRRLDSVFTARFRLSLSDVSIGHAVPFYLQETTGDSDLDNEATLRAFRDYRFRAPNSFLVQTEYNRRIVGPVGLLLFYDAGKVTFARSDLNFSNLRQGFGGGLSFFLAGKVVFRAYVGLGGGEGAHPYFGVANFL